MDNMKMDIGDDVKNDNEKEMEVPHQAEDTNGVFFELISMSYHDELSLEPNCQAIAKSKQSN